MLSIETIYVHVTNRCNLNCIYCYNDSGTHRKFELTTNHLLEFINDLKFVNVNKVVFTGGEPLLRKDIFELANELKYSTKNTLLSITTNGIFINQITARRLVEIFDEIKISIDGPEQVNNILRGEQSYSIVMNAFKEIKEYGGSPFANITLTSLNCNYLGEFIDFLISQGIFKIHISPIKLIGRAKGKNLLCDFTKIGDVITKYLQENFGIFLEQQEGTQNNCGAGRFISINPDGSVFPCYMLSFDELCIGNISKESIISILKKTQLLESLKKIKFDEITQCDVCYKELSVLTKCSDLINPNQLRSKQLIDFKHETLTRGIRHGWVRLDSTRRISSQHPFWYDNQDFV